MALPVEALQAHPRGQISLNGGRMRSAIMGRFSLKNGAQVKHTLAVPANGYVVGNPEVAGSIDMEVSETGPEREFFRYVKQGKVVNFIFELPTLGVEIQGVFETVEVEFPLADAVKITASFVGKALDPVL
jgi:hypothetical protein